jgi:pimeloyl-ACP methyl ester carboxylesterase
MVAVAAFLPSPAELDRARSALQPVSIVSDAQEPLAEFPWVESAALTSQLPKGFQKTTSVCPKCCYVPCQCRLPCLEYPEVTGLACVVSGKVEGGAMFAAAVPAVWKGKLLIYLHGTRPQGSPLAAELNVHDAEFSQLLAEGWMVTSTSYRRHGLALTEALADTVIARRLVEELFRKPSFVVLEGRSMGGTAAILLAERHPELFSAIVTVGAALLNARLAQKHQGSGAWGNEDSGEAKESLTNRPLVPAILMVNESEASPAQRYVSQAWKQHEEGDTDVVVPAMWEIKRPGHNWTTPSERLNAVLHVEAWVLHGTFITRRGTPSLAPPNFEPTHLPSPPPEGLFKVEERRRVIGKVMNASSRGLTISTPRDALRDIGVKLKSRFLLTVGEGLDSAMPVRVVLDEYPFLHTPEYSYCAQFEPEHEFLRIFVHTYEFCNVAKLLRAEFGTTVVVEADPQAVAARKKTANSVVALARSRLQAGRGPALPSVKQQAEGEGGEGEGISK